MLPAALRPLIVLIAVLGALTASHAESARADVARRHAASTACLQNGPGSDQAPERLGFAVLGEPAPASLAGIERSAGEPSSSDDRPEFLPQTRHTLPAPDPRRGGAFAPGERPAALAFLRMNGSANAGGAGT